MLFGSTLPNILCAFIKNTDNAFLRNWLRELKILALNEINQTGKTDIIWFHLYVKSTKNQTHRYREQISSGQRQGVWKGQNGWRGSKRYRLPVIRWIMCSVVTKDNNTVSYIWKLLRDYSLKVLITRKKTFVTMCGDGC